MKTQKTKNLTPKPTHVKTDTSAGIGCGALLGSFSLFSVSPNGKKLTFRFDCKNGKSLSLEIEKLNALAASKIFALFAETGQVSFFAAYGADASKHYRELDAAAKSLGQRD